MIEAGREIASSKRFVVREGRDGGRPVAVKVLKATFAADPQIARRFREEGRRLAGVRHPNVVEVFGVEDVEGRPALVMELADGDLREPVTRGGMAPDQVIEVIGQVTQGLQALARAGIHHSSLNPGNVLRAGGRVKVGDLGTGIEDGTLVDEAPRYAAPEMMGKHRGSPEAQDVYALGLLAFELVAGQARLDALVREQLGTRGSDPSDFMRWSVSPKDLPPLDQVVPGTPAGLARIVEAMVRKDPARRVAGHAALLALLARWRDTGGWSPTEPPAPASPARDATELRDRGPADPTLLIDRKDAAAPKPAAPAAEKPRRPARAPVPPPAAIVEDESSGGSFLSKRRNLLIAGAAVWLLVLGVLFWPKKTATPLVIESTPAGAHVTAGASRKPVGVTPLRVKGPVKPGSEFQFTLAGYEEARVTVQEGQRRIVATLVPMVEPPPVPAAASAPAAPELPTAWELAERLLRVGRPVFASHLEVFPRATPDARVPRPVPIGTLLGLRLESAERGATLVFHIASDATITVMHPHLVAGPLAVEPRTPVTLPQDPKDNIEVLPPSGEEWVFAITTPKPLAPPTMVGSSPHQDKWMVHPLDAGGGQHPAVAFVDWLEGYLRSPGTRWSMAHVEWEVAETASTAGEP